MHVRLCTVVVVYGSSKAMLNWTMTSIPQRTGNIFLETSSRESQVVARQTDRQGRQTKIVVCRWHAPGDRFCGARFSEKILENRLSGRRRG